MFSMQCLQNLSIAFLILYWFIFFRRYILNPYSLATGEILSECFPNLMLAGEYWSKFKLPKDPYWYQDDIIGVGMSSVCYPPNIIISIIMQKLSLNKAFLLYTYVFLLHFLFMSIGGYFLFGKGILGLIGGLLCAYSGYMIKHYPPEVATMAWIIWILVFKSPFLGGFALAISILAGYLPLALYFVYFLIFINFKAVLVALVLASPFLYRVFRYFRKSALTKTTFEDKIIIGTVPKWKILNFFLPLNLRHYINGVGFWENSFYMSPVILFSLFSFSTWWLGVLISGMFLFSVTAFKLFHKFMHRIPARWGHMVTLCLIFTTIDGLSKFPIHIQYIALGITALCLLENRNLMSYYPFHQPAIKPSEAFKEYTGKFPTGQGQIHHIITEGYKGCFRKKNI